MASAASTHISRAGVLKVSTIKKYRLSHSFHINAFFLTKFLFYPFLLHSICLSFQCEPFRKDNFPYSILRQLINKAMKNGFKKNSQKWHNKNNGRGSSKKKKKVQYPTRGNRIEFEFVYRKSKKLCRMMRLRRRERVTRTIAKEIFLYTFITSFSFFLFIRLLYFKKDHV